MVIKARETFQVDIYFLYKKGKITRQSFITKNENADYFLLTIDLSVDCFYWRASILAIYNYTIVQYMARRHWNFEPEACLNYDKNSILFILQ